MTSQRSHRANSVLASQCLTSGASNRPTSATTQVLEDHLAMLNDTGSVMLN